MNKCLTYKEIRNQTDAKCPIKTLNVRRQWSNI